jgi:oxygen-independent coproporphyrinogen-3 oxidase
MTPPRAAYVHIPFCRAKCFYCDFNSYPGMENLSADYVDALLVEIRSIISDKSPLDSVYFGGGTPTTLRPSVLVGVLHALDRQFGVSPGCETTIEANPGTVDLDSLIELRRGGFNRLSIGVQSFDDRILTAIGRIHTADEARDAFQKGRDAGFDNMSIDLMYALPDQSLDDWQRTLESALELAPDHISLYELSVEEGTVFGNLRSRCLLRLPDEDLQIEMYIAAINALTAAGYEHYEVSNFAKPGRRSRHNQTYWRNEPYYGFGAGASGYVGGVRYTNIGSPTAYVDSIRSTGSAVESSEALTGRRSMGETMMLGLRMMDGVDLAAFSARFGVRLQEVYGEELSRLVDRGLVELSETSLRLTPSGLFIANEVAAEFL